MLCLGVNSQSFSPVVENRQCVFVATVMRRLLTGHALYYNRRHSQHGHLFQNRYKLILCQEDLYLLELVRYIHLNPLRAKLTNNLTSLDKYSFCGHSVIMGHGKNNWQNTEAVLRLFGYKLSASKRLYHAFVKKGTLCGRSCLNALNSSLPCMI